MAWTRTSTTCVSVYGALGDLRQYDDQTTFEAARPLTMDALQFYNNTASGDINAANALKLAETLDSSLTNSYAGSYKTGFDKNKAVTALAGILKVSTNTVETLSDTADTIYVF